MVPTWFAKILQALPGRPVNHVRLLMLLVFIANIADNVTHSYFLMPFMILIMAAAFAADWKIGHKEIVDLRDWLVFRGISTTFFISLNLWIISRLVNGLTSWVDYLMVVAAPFILFMDGRIFLKVLERAKELKDWNTVILINRRREETGTS